MGGIRREEVGAGSMLNRRTAAACGLFYRHGRGGLEVVWQKQSGSESKQSNARTVVEGLETRRSHGQQSQAGRNWAGYHIWTMHAECVRRRCLSFKICR